MNKDQFNLLSITRPSAPAISVADLATPYGERTLLLGYDTDGLTWHIYLSEDEIHRYLYRNGSDIAYSSRRDWRVAASLIPTRLYPERCDFAFVEVLLRRGVDIQFAPYNEADHRPGQVFHGQIF